jgi:hypothetical protein
MSPPIEVVRNVLYVQDPMAVLNTSVALAEILLKLSMLAQLVVQISGR